MEKKCIGIDVGGTTVKIGIFETDGTLVYKWEVPSRKEENGAYILPETACRSCASCCLSGIYLSPVQ